MLGSHVNLLESLINLSVSVIIPLFSENRKKSKLSSPYNKVLRVKGAMCPIAFWSVTLGLLYRGQTNKNEIHFHLQIHTSKQENRYFS